MYSVGLGWDWTDFENGYGRYVGVDVDAVAVVLVLVLKYRRE